MSTHYQGHAACWHGDKRFSGNFCLWKTTVFIKKIFLNEISIKKYAFSIKYIFKIFFKLIVALTAVGAVACGVALKKSTVARLGAAGMQGFPVPPQPGQDNYFPAKNHYDCQTCTKTRYWAAKWYSFETQSLKISTFLWKRISLEKAFLNKNFDWKNRCSRVLELTPPPSVECRHCVPAWRLALLS